MDFFDQKIESIQSDWQQRPASEQRIISVVSVLALLCAAYFFIVEPLAEYRDKQQTRLVQKNKVYAQSQTLVQRIQARRSAGNDEAGEGLAKMMDDSLRQYNLSMRGFQPGRNGDARLRLSDVDYASLVKWLYDIEYNKNIIIDELAITSSKDSNLLVVNVRVKKG